MEWNAMTRGFRERRLRKSEEKKERGKMCYGFMYTMMSYGSLGKRDGVECDDEGIPRETVEEVGGEEGESAVHEQGLPVSSPTEINPAPAPPQPEERLNMSAQVSSQNTILEYTKCL
ncbi:hypothetical protein NDU88_007703 [Pleurodeles waltl]|uniref:Uncharacterized protein n=1 Tax=Pleurodeles waltl TaxID=8319 RepID=A0AAV7ST99_PLEWA|nr:hypothetical protein NDU88_007703 [Pleurodeles waltl]